MPRQIFVNLPVRDLPVSLAFYKALGFKNEKKFTDTTAACMVISDTIFVMLLTHAKYKQFTKKKIIDAAKSTGAILALSLDSRKAVDSMVKKALKAGGSSPRPATDLGFMYQANFDDPDGHSWELFHMSAMPE
jgi:uncharacterized protein